MTLLPLGRGGVELLVTIGGIPKTDHGSQNTQRNRWRAANTQEESFVRERLARHN